MLQGAEAYAENILFSTDEEVSLYPCSTVEILPLECGYSFHRGRGGGLICLYGSSLLKICQARPPLSSLFACVFAIDILPRNMLMTSSTITFIRLHVRCVFFFWRHFADCAPLTTFESVCQ